MKSTVPRREMLGQRVIPELRVFASELSRRLETELGLPSGTLNTGFGTEVALNAIRYLLDRAPKAERWTLQDLLDIPFDQE